MTDTLIVPYAPSPSGTGQQVQARLLSAPMGDNYRQELADGVNPVTRTYNLVWDLLPVEDANTLVAFLEAHVAVPFFYRLPRDQAPRTLIWKSFSRTFPQPFHDSVTVTVEERFVY